MPVFIITRIENAQIQNIRFVTISQRPIEFKMAIHIIHDCAILNDVQPLTRFLLFRIIIICNINMIQKSIIATQKNAMGLQSKAS